MNGAEILQATRSAAIALIDREERRVGSRMSAYETVAKTIGVSASWLRKFVRGEAGFSIAPFSILHQYDRLCSRIEQETQAERDEAHALRGQIYAAIQINLALVASEARTPPAAEGSEESS